MSRMIKGSRRKKRGVSPGTMEYVGEHVGQNVEIRLFQYDQETCLERKIAPADLTASLVRQDKVTWIDLDGVNDVKLIEHIGKIFDLHPLVTEDVVNTNQRPKVEEYDKYIYIVVHMMTWDESADAARLEQVSLILGQGYVLSLQETPGDVFDPVRERLRSAKGRLRRVKADYLAYALIDAVVDGYFGVMEHLSARVEALEDELVGHPDKTVLNRLHRLKRESLMIRRSAWPMRETVGSLQRLESPLIEPALRMYLRDVYDHAMQVVDTMETLREVLSGMLDTYLSCVSNRMNEVMKVLTLIATIFIPLTFLAGVYGMNFKHMPELDQPWAYPAVWAIMLLVGAGMVLFFRRKHWI